MKKSASIADLMMAAPKQRMEIAPFDDRTLQYFRLPEGKMFRNPSALDPESEAKRKRKVRTQRSRLGRSFRQTTPSIVAGKETCSTSRSPRWYPWESVCSTLSSSVIIPRSHA